MIYLARPDLWADNGLIRVYGNDFRYLFNVRRVRGDEAVLFFNGREVFETVLLNTGRNEADFSVKARKTITAKQVRLNIVIPMADSGAVEESIRNGIEAGADDFYLWRSKRSNTKKDFFEKKLERLNQIILSAASQSRRRYISRIFIMDMEEIIKLEGSHIALHPDINENPSAQNELIHNTFLWIGPEGGFDESEISLYKKSGFQFRSFTAPILRMENAVTLAAGFYREIMGYNSDVFAGE